eukprot:4661376-Pleurochrysis_carterae.AAC.4
MHEVQLRLLGLHLLQRWPTDVELREAYSKQASRYHADNGGDPFLWARIQEAYDVLRETLDQSQLGELAMSDEESEEADDATADDGNSADDEKLAPWQSELDSFDLHSALGLAPRTSSSRFANEASRIRSAFHRICAYKTPLESNTYLSSDLYDKDVLRFRRACLAFAVLKDEARAEVYAAC